MMADDAAARPADGLDLVEKEDRAAVGGGFAEPLEALADVALRLTHPRPPPLRRLYHREAAPAAGAPRPLAGGDPHEQRLADAVRPDQDRGLAAAEPVARGLRGVDEDAREDGQQELEVLLLSADLLAPDLGDLVEQEPALRRTVELLERDPGDAVPEQLVTRRELDAVERRRDLDDDLLVPPLEHEAVSADPAFEEGGVARLRNAVRPACDDDVHVLREEDLLARQERREVDVSRHLDQPPSAGADDERLEADRRLERAQEHGRVPRCRAEPLDDLRQ